MAGYILILAIVILGGAIATVGDRLGTRVGKARLSLFNLRPKNTAVLVTILTGSFTAATTLGILLATNKQLRDMIFRADEILKRSRLVQEQLDQALTQKTETEVDLSVTRAELTESVRRLRKINDSMKTAVSRQKVSEEKLRKLRSRYEFAQSTLRRYSTQAKNLRSQIDQLGEQKQRLSQEQQRLVAQRNEIQARLQQADTQKQTLEAAAEKARQRIQNVEQEKENLESAITQAKTQLQTAQAQESKLQASVEEIQVQLQQATNEQLALRQERTQLDQEVAALEENRQRLLQSQRLLLQGLRFGNVTIRAGQVLATGVIQDLKSREEALQAINALRLEARRTAIVLTNPRNLVADQQVVEMTKEDVEGILNQVSDGNSYVVRILSALNYLEGEQQVIAVPQIALNRPIFDRGQAVATVTLNPATLTDEQILSRINALFSAANRRAIAAGVLPDPVTGTVGSFRQVELFRFVIALKARNDNTNIEIQGITTDKVYSSGPLALGLSAVLNGQVILQSS